jgi:choline dehydrogenase-like flavoprotein
MADKTAHSKHLKGKIAKRLVPSQDKDLQDTKQATRAVHDLVLSEYHPCGSIALGDAVDNRLIVKGTRNIRVADASVFPNHVSGNIVSSVYAVAEKAADIIKEDWDYAALAKAA